MTMFTVPVLPDKLLMFEQFILGNTPDKLLLEASQSGDIDKVKLVLEQGANINFKDSLGHTPLINAVINNDSEMVEFLMENGTKTNLKDNSGMTPMMYADFYKHHDLIQLFKNK